MVGISKVWRGVWLVGICLGIAAAGAGVRTQEPLLPDIIVTTSDLFDHDISHSGDQLLLRLSNATANIGRGKFHLFGVVPGNGDGTQNVMQRVYYSDGSTEDIVAGRFVFHPAHNHIHIEAWASYTLRQITPGGGVGDVIAEGEKTSFCILDLRVHDDGLPGFVPRGEFRTCGSTVQGLSVGWADVYSKTLPGQNINITNVPEGTYWLESVVDPDNNFVEADKDNNVARIQVTVGNPNLVNPDAYEPNESPGAVDERQVGAPNSANLGPTNPKRIIQNLTLDRVDDEDYFKFYAPAIGTDQDFVRLDYQGPQAGLKIALYDVDLNALTVSQTGFKSEMVSLAGLPAGWYYARVFSPSSQLNAGYRLTVNPPLNESPSISVLEPAAGNQVVIHGAEHLTVRWSVEDPETNFTWVSVALNTARELDGNEVVASTARLVPGEQGFAVVNSSEFAFGTYWVYCQVTDGGSTTGVWAEGTVTFEEISEECRPDDHAAGAQDDGGVGGHETTDCNENNIADACDVDLGLSPDCDGNGVPDECDVSSGAAADLNGNGRPDACDVSFHRGDPNNDGNMELTDGVAVLQFLFQGRAAPTCLESADANNSGVVDLTDGVHILRFLFASGEALAPPGGPDSPCGVDPDPAGSERDLGCEVYTACASE